MWACGVIYMCMRLGRYTWHEASEGDPIWDGFLYRRDRYLSIGDLHTSGEFPVAQPHQQPQSDQAPHLQPHQLQHAPHHINLTSLEQVSHITLAWPNHISDVIEHLLEPDTRKRWQAVHVLDSDWFHQSDNCHPVSRPPEQVLDESDFQDAVVAPVCPSSQRVGSKVVPEETDVTGCKIVKEVRDRRSAATNGGGSRNGSGGAIDKDGCVAPVS